MSATSAQSVPTRRPIHGITSRGTARARWALLTTLVVGAAGGAGISGALVHSQIRIVHDVRTVYVPVPSDPVPSGSGNVQRKV